MATEAAAKSAQPEEGSRTRRTFWRRIPTPLLVTLVGLALSAWLLPAITRQWDDRQKAHQLEAALVADMASATARTLVEGEDLHARGRYEVAPYGQHSLEWSRGRLQIEARLYAYFPPELLEEWRLFSYFVSYFNPAARSAGLDAFAAGSARYLEDRAQNDPGDVYPAYYYDLRWLAPRGLILHRSRRKDEVFCRDCFPAPGIDPAPIDDTDIERVNAYRQSALAKKYADFEAGLLSFESDIADQVLSADPKGYSTTTGDLLHDLVP